MPNYQTGKIYRIYSPDEPDLSYYGSTVQKLCKRYASHKKDFNKGLKSKYCTSFLILEKYNNTRIELVENFSCDNKEQLTAREGFYIRTCKCVNKQLPQRSKKEWYQDNKKILYEKQKIYQIKNKDIIAIRQKIYQEKNKEKISKYKKEYRKKNIKKIKENSKIYREKNKEIIKTKKKNYREKKKKK